MSSASSRPKVRFVKVDAEYQGQRLDNFLMSQLKGVPRSHVYRLVRRGEVRINRGRVAPSYRLQSGDQVRIPPVRTANRTVVVAPTPQWVEDILFEDENLLALNKPAGVTVHAGTGVRAGVIESLRQARPDCTHLDLVHRLDRDTSGCLLIAKRRKVLKALHASLRNATQSHSIRKQYLALVRGPWSGKSTTVNAALRKGVPVSGERIVRVDEQGGRQANSEFRPLTVFQDASLMKITLYTGRTHQARVHAAHLGHPIAGDTKYGDKAFNAAMRKLGLRRQFLHAASLRFVHPETNKQLEITAPLPEELQQVMEQLADD